MYSTLQYMFCLINRLCSNIYARIKFSTRQAIKNQLKAWLSTENQEIITKVNFENKRFLIVDNVKPSIDTLKHFALNQKASRVDISYNTRDVMIMCKNIVYDVIFLGYDFGAGQKNGQQILEELRLNDFINRQCIVFIVTAEVSQAMVLAALEHKPDDYVSKPFSLKDLIKRLDRCFVKKSGMGNIYQAMDAQDYQKVIKLCEQALMQNTPYETECLGIKSRQHFELGQYSQAKEIYQAQQYKVNCQWATIGLGKVAMLENKLEEATRLFEALVTENPLYLSTYDLLAKAYLELQEYTKAEDILEQALLISPRSVVRLKQFANICLQNEQYEKATNAFQKTTELAYNSIHHTPDNALLLARALIEYSNDLSPQNIRKMNNKAFKALAVMNKEFSSSEYKIQSHLLSACLFTNSNEVSAAKEMLFKAEDLLETTDQDISPLALIEIAKSLSKLKKYERSRQIIVQVAQQHAEDISVMHEVDKLAASSLSKDDTRLARKSLEIGISYYKENNFVLAIQELNNAFKLFPTHNGIKLNLLQVLLVSFETDKQQVNDLQQASIIISTLDDILPDDNLYVRYSKLKEKYETLV